MSPEREQLLQMVREVPDEEIETAIVFLAGLIRKEETPTDEDEKRQRAQRAFDELKKMRRPFVADIDVKKELAEWRDEKYGYSD